MGELEKKIEEVGLKIIGSGDNAIYLQKNRRKKGIEKTKTEQYETKR